MMLPKSLILVLSVLTVVKSGTIGSSRNIPVEVRYDRPEDVHEYNRSMRDEEKQETIEQIISETDSMRLEAAEIDLAEAEKCEGTTISEFPSTESAKEIIPKETKISHQIHNLDERVQLSQEEIVKARNNLPIADKDLSNEISEETEEKPSNSILNQAENIIYNGIHSIRNKVEEYAADNQGVSYISENVWRDLNSSLDNMITTLKEEQQQNRNQTFFQSVLGGFQLVSSNFLQGIRRNNTQSEEQPAFGQNIINFFTGGFQQISGNLSSFGSGDSSTQSTVLSDVDESSPSNPVSGFVNQVQNFFTGQQQQISQAFQPNQSDPESGGSQQGSNIFQNAANQIGQVFNSFASTSPPNSQNEEESSNQQPLQIFQNAATQIGQVFNNANPFKPQANNSESDEETGSNPTQFFQNAAIQIGQAINNANPFKPQANNSESDEETGQQNIFQNAANQIGQVFNQFRPGQPSTNAPPSESDTSTQSSNPIIAGIQEAGTQVQQFLGNQSSSNPLQGIQGSFGGGNSSGFTPPSIENIGNQFSESISNFTPPSTRLEAANVKSQDDSINNVIASKSYADTDKQDLATDDKTENSDGFSTTTTPEEIMTMEESVQKEVMA